MRRGKGEERRKEKRRGMGEGGEGVRRGKGEDKGGRKMREGRRAREIREEKRVCLLEFMTTIFFLYSLLG